ncbi:MAG: RNA methyltransferase [Flavobacteriales bacterium]|nr:RNA methyltransferase [Flavobacteriales bacterium]
MPSISEIKKIKSLQQKKFRRDHNAFIVEGEKMIQELLASDYEIESLYSIIDASHYSLDGVHLISEKELGRISALKNPNQALAVVRIKKTNPLNVTSILLDGVRDPGNLGTIIRIADWYGIQQVICSVDTTDCYNPKVVQSTMGSLFRVNVVYADLKPYISESELPTFAAMMVGDEVNKSSGQFNLLMGSESHGIRDGLEELVTSKISIARRGRAESLNVGVATGILLDRLIG